MAGGATFSKRQKERKRQDLQREKLEKRRQRAQENQATGSGPEIDWDHSQADMFNTPPSGESGGAAGGGDAE